MIINSTQQQDLYDYYEKYVDTNAIFVTGKKGLGKSFVIQNFLSGKQNIIHISVYGKSNFSLEPVYMAINRFYMLIGQKYICDNSTDLDVREKLNMELIKICTNQRIIVYFENVSDYDGELFAYVKELLSLLIHHYPNLQTFFIFEIDTDACSNTISEIQPERLYSVAPTFEYISFETHNEKVLGEYFGEIFHNNIKISDEDLEYIINASSGNLSCFHMIINYLKQKSIITRCESGYTCSTIEPGALANILYDSLMFRFNLLNDEMKKMLAQSVLIGFNFETEMLRNIFQILKADEHLKRIERISSLICEEDDLSYRFENFEIYKMVLDNIETAERQHWNSLLASYYEKQLNRNLSGEKTIRTLCKTAFHYTESMSYEKAIYYYITLVKTEIANSDYRQAIIFIQEIEKLAKYTKEITLKYLEAFVSNYKGECYKTLGYFTDAVNCYKDCLSLHQSCYAETELINLKLNLSYCLYMNGYLPESLELVLKVKDVLLANSSKDILLYRTLSFLSSVYHLLGDDIQAEEYYVASLTYCTENNFEEEYYIQLKKAGMIFDIEVAQPLIQETIDYFSHHNKISLHAETLHNFATNNLYLMQLNSFEKDCRKSIDLFRQYGSLLVHYPLNTLGIYMATIRRDLDSAIICFKEALEYDIESFSKVSIHTNLATCYRCKKDFENCYIHMKTADSLIEQEENEEILLLQTYHYINNALYHKASGNESKALLLFEQCLKVLNPEARHKFLISHYMKDIYSRLHGNIPQDVTKGCEIITHPFMSLCAENDMFFATMRFYE